MHTREAVCLWKNGAAQLRLEGTADQLWAKLLLQQLPLTANLYAQLIRPAAQPLLVEYARNVGPPLFGSQPD